MNSTRRKIHSTHSRVAFFAKICALVFKYTILFPIPYFFRSGCAFVAPKRGSACKIGPTAPATSAKRKTERAAVNPVCAYAFPSPRFRHPKPFDRSLCDARAGKACASVRGETPRRERVRGPSSTFIGRGEFCGPTAIARARAHLRGRKEGKSGRRKFRKK